MHLKNKDLKRLDQLPKESLDPEFLKVGAKFRDFVLQFGKTKAIDGKSLDGESYVNLIRQYVEAVKEGCAYIEDAFDCVIATSNQKALEKALKEMEISLKSVANFPMSLDNCNKALEVAKEIATQLYLSIAINSEKEGGFDNLTEVSAPT